MSKKKSCEFLSSESDLLQLTRRYWGWVFDVWCIKLTRSLTEVNLTSVSSHFSYKGFNITSALFKLIFYFKIILTDLWKFLEINIFLMSRNLGPLVWWLNEFSVFAIVFHVSVSNLCKNCVIIYVMIEYIDLICWLNINFIYDHYKDSKVTSSMFDRQGSKKMLRRC